MNWPPPRPGTHESDLLAPHPRPGGVFAAPAYDPDTMDRWWAEYGVAKAWSLAEREGPT